MISDGIYQALTSYDPVSTVVSDRVYPALAPAPQEGGSQYPLVVFFQTGAEFPEGLEDEATEGLDEVRFTVECYGATYDAAKELAGEVREFFRNNKHHSGQLGSKRVEYTRIEDERDEAEYANDGADPRLFCTAVDVVICYNPTGC